MLFTSDGVHLYWVFTLQDTKQPQQTQQQNQEQADFDLYVVELKLEIKVRNACLQVGILLVHIVY